MPRVLVVLPSQTYRAGDFLRAADELGVDLIVASEVEPPIDMGDRYLKIECDSPELAAETIVAAGDRVPIDGIVAADDGGVVVAALAGTKLGLISNEPQAARAARDKSLQRRHFSSSEVPQPRWSTLQPGDDAVAAAEALGFPLVIKPLDRAAGQGVLKVGSVTDLEAALSRIRRIFPDGEERTYLLEEFLEGSEVAVEGILGPDGFLTLAIFDKPDSWSGDGFQETILVTPSRHDDDVQTECVRVAAAAVSAIGLTHGSVHVELMVTDNGVRVIEVAARSIGGLCSKSLKFGLMDTSLEALILRNALGRDKRELRRDNRASGVLMIPIPGAGTVASIEGIDEVASSPGVTSIDITAGPGEKLSPPPEGDRYLGFVFANGDSPSRVEEVLRQAMKTIQVRMS